MIEDGRVHEARKDEAGYRHPVYVPAILRGKRKPQFTVHVRPRSTSNVKGGR